MRGCACLRRQAGKAVEQRQQRRRRHLWVVPGQQHHVVFVESAADARGQREAHNHRPILGASTGCGHHRGLHMLCKAGEARAR